LTAVALQGPPAGAPPGAPPAGAPPPPGGRGPQQPPSVAAIDVQKLRDNLYVLTGGGGNTTVFVTANNGVVVIDTKLPGWGKPLQEKIRTLTDKPITTIINTHVHGDHTSGNVDFPTTVNIVVQANTKTDMEKMDLFKGENAKFLPRTTFQDKLSLFSGADRIDLYYFGPGGTDGDAWIVIPALSTAVGGDAFANRAVTLIDRNNGGSATSYLQALTRVASEIRGVNTVVTGHGGVLTWNDLAQYVDFNREFQAWVRAAKQAGKTVEEASMEYKHPDKYQGYTPPNPMQIRNYIQAIYDEAR
jgi:glyoxylase-like metal-dependent hydrolase (beta-lactamase superfamily II)